MWPMLSGLEDLLGLPLHPLVVHLVVVLLPLTAIGAILSALWPSFARRYGALNAVVVWVAAVSTWVAEQAGEALALRVGVPTEHLLAAEPLPPLASVFAIVMTVFWLFDRGVPGNRRRPWWLRLLAVALVFVSVAVIVLTVRAGHTGATAVWG